MKTEEIIKYDTSYNEAMFLSKVDHIFIMILDAIMDNNYDDRPCYERIIIKYFNNEEIYSEDIEAIECIDLEDNRKTYYTLLFLIFILDFYTKKLLS